jgi:GLUG motif-containing protein
MSVRFRLRAGWHLCVLVAISLICVPSLAAQFAGGSGTPDDPYQIATAEQLCSIGADPNLLDKHYVLLKDIDLDPNLPGRRVFDRAVIAPDMRDQGASKRIDFTGGFDGAHHRISNLTIRADTGTWLGLFGRIGETGKIRDLAVENVSITGGARAGALAGWNMGEIVNCHSSGHVKGKMMLGGLVGQTGGHVRQCHSTAIITGGEKSFDLGGLAGMAMMMDVVIRGCHATGNVSAGHKSWSLGGLVGSLEMPNGQVSRCYATGRVSSGSESSGLGGLVGSVSDGTIKYSYATGDVTGGDGSRSLGGLAGWFSGRALTDCYATGDVTGGNGVSQIGGLAGSASPMRGVVTNCYAIGKLNAEANSRNVGGLIGETPKPDFIAVANCFWNTETSGVRASAAGQGLTTLQMQDITIYRKAGWDFAGDNTDGTADTWHMPQGARYPELAVFSSRPQPQIVAGSGTSQDPYLIAQVQDLRTINEKQPAYFKLVADIDLSGITWANAPVPEFSGGFEGNGHRITNLTIRSSKPEDLGFFGLIKGGAWVRNLGVENVSIVGPPGVRGLGGLAGSSYGHIANCYATGRVSAGGDSLFLGGLVGDSRRGTIRSCYSSVEIVAGTGTRNVGGLTGYSYICTITNSYASGAISTETGCDNIGGLVGAATEGISGCFWNLEASGVTESDGGSGLTTAQMQKQQTFLDAGWDFVGEQRNGLADTWQTPEAGEYPVLAVFADDYQPPTLSGSGTAQDPYRVATPRDFVAINLLNRQGHYRLSNNIDLSEITWSQAPVSTFIGTFDGAGFSISNLTVQGGNRLGLFGTLGSQAKVQNLTLKDANITGNDKARCIGALAGGTGGTIINCYVTGRVAGGRQARAIGGLIGEAGRGVVRNCYADCVVSGGNEAYHIGGLTGYTLSAKISACCATGNVTGAEKSRCVGGLIGEVHFWSMVSDCYATGRVSAGTESMGIGGLVGVASEGDLFPSPGMIANSYAANIVEAAEGSSYLGGLLGIETKTQPLTKNCRFLTHPASVTLDNGNGTALTEAQMQQQSSFPGWDFDTVWTLRAGQGYPRLRWEAE